METSVPGVFVAGDGGCVNGYEAAIIEGRIAALEACAQLGLMEGKRTKQLQNSYRSRLLPHKRIGNIFDASCSPGSGVLRHADSRHGHMPL